MSKILPTLIVSGTLALLGPNKAFCNEKISDNSLETKDKTSKVLQSETNNLSKILGEKLDELGVDEQIKNEIKEWFKDEKFKKEFFSILKKEYNWSIENVILSLILGFLYGYAYYGTIKKAKSGADMPAVSFGVFSFTSGGMVLINGFLPGSLVYFESFLLASYVVFLHYKNLKNGKVFNSKQLNSFIDENPLPIVRYDKNGKPTMWNKKMEEETGYTLEEVLEYFEENEEVMSLLYKGKNLEKVKQYLDKIKETGIGYKNIAFTMNTKTGEEKTFLWTTLPDGLGGTIRTARLLTDEAEIKEELQRTKELLNNSYKEIEQKDDKEKLEKLDEAIIEGRIVPFFQPIFYANDTSKIYKYEVLMRVKNKNGGYDLPGEYLETAKKYNRLVSIFNIIFRKTFIIASKNNINFSINLSGQDISNPDLVEILISEAKRYGVDPGRITLEILEGEWNANFDHLDIITKIKSKRFRIAMDDFGSDNSNLNRLLDLLKNKQIDELKVDGHIIKYLTDKEKGLEIDSVKLSTLTKEILKGIINACHKAGVAVTAEYIENEEILQECRDLKIDFLQGFYLSKPLENIC